MKIAKWRSGSTDFFQRNLMKRVLRWFFFFTDSLVYQITKRVALPGFDSLPVYDVAVSFFTGIQQGSIVTRAQSLAFSFFLTHFFATIFSFFAHFPYIPIHDFQPQLLELIQNILPKNAYESARTTIEDIIKIQRGGLLSFGFLLALYFTQWIYDNDARFQQFLSCGWDPFSVQTTIW